MPKLTIDRREVEVAPGATILDAARKLGIDVPALCHLQGRPPSTSCLVCLVKVCNNDRLVPSCATVAEDAMEIESETEEVHELRRSALELLLSDHLGDCLAPCYFACPAHMDVPQMLRQIHRGELRDAIVTVKAEIALPAVLGRICPAPCEKACRRKGADGAVAICRLKQFAADSDLDGQQAYRPPCKSPTGKRVAVIGAGPTGLAAAYYLRQCGHACTIFDENDTPGGRLQRETTRDQLPREVLAKEIETILCLGVELRAATRVGRTPALADLQDDFDAVLIACGASAKEQAESWGLAAAARGIEVDKETYRAGVEGLFAAGNAIRNKPLVVRSVADGKQAAGAIDRFLTSAQASAAQKPFNTRIGSVDAEEMKAFLQLAGKGPPRDPAAGFNAGYTSAEAAEAARRCLHCDCRGLYACKLRKYSAIYRADPRRYRTVRRSFRQDVQHAEVIYEPGKCIDCGLCIEISRAGGEPLGLTFVGRGFDVRMSVPLGGTLDEALRKVAAECVAACPTAALAWRREEPGG